MDDTVEFDMGHKRRVAQQGRRAAGANGDIGNTLGGGGEGDGRGQRPSPPSKPKMTGWGEVEQKGRARMGMSHKAFDDDDDNGRDIPQIPDLEDMNEVDFIQTTAAPPSVRVQQVPTLVELESDLIRHAALLTLDDDTDLKLLASKLHAREEVLEDDRVWDWDTVFTDITSALHADDDAGDEASHSPLPILNPSPN